MSKSGHLRPLHMHPCHDARSDQVFAPRGAERGIFLCAEHTLQEKRAVFSKMLLYNLNGCAPHVQCMCVCTNFSPADPARPFNFVLCAEALACDLRSDETLLYLGV